MAAEALYLRKPDWLRRPPGSAAAAVELKRLLRSTSLNTVCEEARCPNIAECFSRKTATFMILGDVCTRGCRFCAVKTGRPSFAPAEFEAEGERVAIAAKELGLRHVVVTSVARDDLENGGAEGFKHSIAALRKVLPGSTVEVLIPDFRGSEKALQIVLDAQPDVLNHNLETVPRLYRRVRPGSSYSRSLELLLRSKRYSSAIRVKTGIMLGLGEARVEVEDLFRKALDHGVDIFTAGQYLQPSRNHLPVERYLTPDEFQEYQTLAESLGFPQVFIGALVRSSYHADELVQVPFDQEREGLKSSNG